MKTEELRYGVRFRDGSVKDDFMSHAALLIAAGWRGCDLVLWNGVDWETA